MSQQSEPQSQCEVDIILTVPGVLYGVLYGVLWGEVMSIFQL